MHIYYQGFPGAYGNKASMQAAQIFHIPYDNIVGVESFQNVFTHINTGSIGVVPIENSYAGSIHENFYHIISGEYRIIGEICLDINHYLLGKADDISQITTVYSHQQALMQCQKYCQSYHFISHATSDTAGAAKEVSEQDDVRIAAIASDLCAQIYGLKQIDANIQDQDGNTTRFFVIVLTSHAPQYVPIFPKVGKISIQFRTNDTPSALYKCLGAFATRHINMIKIESLPAKENRFEYIFWVDIQGNADDLSIQSAFEELQFFCRDFRILWSY